jgi:manganese transport protein
MISNDARKPKETGLAQSRAGEAGMTAGVDRGAGRLSLSNVHSSVRIPAVRAGLLEQYRAFAGPALLVSVGYMDPGNWGTDLQGGAQYKYGLMWVVLLASLMAIVLQVIAARLGVATGKDLAQAARAEYPSWTRIPNWLLAEVAIAACDLAEVLGSAVAINLLFHIPILWAVMITAADVLLLLALQRLGMRLIEAVVLVLVATIGVCFFLELFVLPRTIPNFREIGAAILEPGLRQAGMATVAVGIIGATVMPHNLYLHSALVQSRQLRPDDASKRVAIRWNTVDAVVALSLAFFVNAAILVLAAITFYGRSGLTVGRVAYAFNADTDWIRIAFLTLAPLLGTVTASLVFAIALLASGQSSTITGTLAGQVVMEGFLDLRVSPWLRRLITRLVAIVPAVAVIAIQGGGGVNALLVLSQVVLALQLPFAMFPLLHLTGKRSLMGRWRNGWFLLTAGWGSAVLITAMDLYGLPGALSDTLKIFGRG